MSVVNSPIVVELLVITVLFCVVLSALSVSGGTSTIIRSTYNCNYSIWYGQSYLLPSAVVEELELDNSSTTAEGGRYGLTVTHAVITVICAPEDGWSYYPKNVDQFTEM